MNGNMDSDPGFRFLSSATQHNMLELPSSSSNAVNYGPKPKPRKKRSKLISVDVDGLPTCSTVVSRPKYAKKPDPAAPKITPPCSECGKKFWSWKALFGHMRCHPERQWRGINPPPNHSRPVKPTNNVEALMTEDDHEIAASLLLLANGTAALSESECGTSSQPGVQETEASPEHMGAKYPFECSSCKKVFGSHQALGGHRASHKNVKGCFAITRSDDCDIEDRSCDEDGLVKENVDDDSSKLMMVLGHKCSICLKVFTSGQALGGHKRCHWDKGDEPSLSHGINLLTPKEDCGLDLNLPAPIENDPSSSSSYFSSLALDLRLSL